MTGIFYSVVANRSPPKRTHNMVGRGNLLHLLFLFQPRQSYTPDAARGFTYYSSRLSQLLRATMPIECFHDSFAVSRFLQSLVCETRAAMGVITALRRWTDLFFFFFFVLSRPIPSIGWSMIQPGRDQGLFHLPSHQAIWCSTRYVPRWRYSILFWSNHSRRMRVLRL